MCLQVLLCHLVSHFGIFPRIASLTKAGMAKAVADTKGENQAGFAFDTEVVTGFSHMHDDGTGGVGFYQRTRISLFLTYY
jgi:putative alpha-1,2-mannosidase